MIPKWSQNGPKVIPKLSKTCHKNIAKLWSAYKDVDITAHDVAIMMVLLKIARTKLGAVSSDTYIDGSAYMSIAGECKSHE